MQFKGHLLLPNESGPGLRVNLDVAEHHLAVESDEGGLGAWPLEVVNVERLQGDIFALTVAGEPLRFVADDTIAFTYSGVPSIDRVSRRPRTRSALRGMFERIWNGPEEPGRNPSVPPASDDTSSNNEPTEEILTADAEAEDSEVVEDTIPVLDADDATPQPNDMIPLVEDAVSAVEGASGAVPSVPAAVPDSDMAGEDLAGSEGCPAIRTDGRRCQSPILTSSGFCYPHDPKRAFEDRYQAALEARAQLKREATARLNRIYGRLEKAMRQVERGELDPETAMAMAQLARTMCAILDIDEPAADDLG